MAKESGLGGGLRKLMLHSNVKIKSSAITIYSNIQVRAVVLASAQVLSRVRRAKELRLKRVVRLLRACVVFRRLRRSTSAIGSRRAKVPLRRSLCSAAGRRRWLHL